VTGPLPPDYELSASADPCSRVSAVIVTHNSAAVIGACLESVAAAERLIVVDNASRDDTLAVVGRLRPDAEVIGNDRGVGFGNASNQGLARVATEFALHLNPDATIHPGAVEALVAAADYYPEAGLLGPCILDPNGGARKNYDFARHRRHGMSMDRTQETLPDGPCCTWFISGAVWLHRMSALREVGPFDPAFYLYFEDDDICARYIDKGYRLLYLPEAVASHIGGGSGRAGWKTLWEQNYYFAWSHAYYEAKYNGRAAGTRFARQQIRLFGRRLRHRIADGDFERALRLTAKIVGGLAYLLRIPTSKTVRRARPERR
jgi:N-acetylglucosaminyl-diphospho-decaprenol L-rhamnosyltransferase